MLVEPWNDCFLNGGVMGLEEGRIVVNGAASAKIAELQCASNEVEDTCLSPPLHCSLAGIQWV